MTAKNEFLMRSHSFQHNVDLRFIEKSTIKIDASRRILQSLPGSRSTRQNSRRKQNSNRHFSVRQKLLLREVRRTTTSPDCHLSVRQFMGGVLLVTWTNTLKSSQWLVIKKLHMCDAIQRHLILCLTKYRCDT